MFDPEAVDLSTPIPDGEYTAMITASEMRQTRSGNGAYLELTVEIQDGPHAGRRIYDRLNLENPNSQAVSIARRTLAQICHAVGVLQLQDTEQLHNRPFVAIVRTEPGRDGYGPRNIVRGYKKAPGAQPEVKPAPKKAPWEE
jgi:hypothetical protein